MKTIQELLNLYDDFFNKLNTKLAADPQDPIVRSEPFENASDSQIDDFAKQSTVYIPDDIRTFWKSLKGVYTASVFDGEEWEAGWDFISLKYVIRETKGLRDLANNYEDSNPLKNLHQYGVNLTYEEPILLFDGNPETKKGGIHELLWDGDTIPGAIAPDFTTFFEHWLASGCFKGRNFEAYHKIVKDIIPIQIPLKDNLWLQFYAKQYKIKIA